MLLSFLKFIIYQGHKILPAMGWRFKEGGSVKGRFAANPATTVMIVARATIHSKCYRNAIFCNTTLSYI